MNMGGIMSLFENYERRIDQILPVLNKYDIKDLDEAKTICDNAKIGSNSVLVAPVTTEKGANVGALSVITADVPENALAVTRSPMRVIKDWVLKITKGEN